MARVEALRARLERVYAGRADDDPIDRAFGAVVERHAIPRALPEALLAGMEMDARGARYDERRGAARLLLPRRRHRRAHDDARDGRRRRRRLPARRRSRRRDAADQHRARRRRGRAARARLPAGGAARRRRRRSARAPCAALLARAEAHYRAADRGVPLLPRDCRFAIASARNIYSAIGGAIARNGYDSVSQRAYVSLPRKLLARRARAARALRFVATPGDAHARRGRPTTRYARSLRAVGLPA